jgi:hypothetical protein
MSKLSFPVSRESEAQVAVALVKRGHPKLAFSLVVICRTLTAVAFCASAWLLGTAASQTAASFKQAPTQESQPRPPAEKATTIGSKNDPR